MTYEFFVHEAQDSVGVAVVDITAGQTARGWVMADDGTVEVRAAGNIPLGHKIALANLGEGQKVIKYGEPIGKTTKPVAKGEHVHTQNLKSLRW